MDSRRLRHQQIQIRRMEQHSNDEKINDEKINDGKINYGKIKAEEKKSYEEIIGSYIFVAADFAGLCRNDYAMTRNDIPVMTVGLYGG